MIVYPEKLKAALTKGIRPLYIVSGDEPLLVQENSDMVRQHLRTKGFSEREVHHVDARFDWQTLLFSANSMSLFAEQKLIELRLTRDKPGDQGVKALAECLKDPSDSTCILIVMPRLDANTMKTKWFKNLESRGLMVRVFPIERERIPGWIQGRMNAAGLKPDREAVEILSDRIEGNLLAASQEVERLALLSPDGRVDVDMVLASVADSARYDVFGMIDAALLQNTGRAVRMLRGIQGEGADTLFVVNMLAKELRMLASISEAMARGQSMDQQLRAYRVWDKRKPAVTRCLKQCGLAVLQEAHTTLAMVDRMVKGMAAGDPWDTLESVLMMVSGKPALDQPRHQTV